MTVIAAPDPEAVGRRLAVTADSVAGTLGSSEVDERAVELARASLRTREGRLERVELGEATWELYVESQGRQPELVIVGAGHIARPLCAVAAMLDFRVTVIDDRPDYAAERWFPAASRVLVVEWDAPFEAVSVGPDTYIVLVTRGHKYDYDCIQRLLTMEGRPAYLGMIGSRRRVTATFEALVADGIEPALLENVHAPIGLDIGAETPEEIAVAIAAEIIAIRRGGSGARLTEQQRVLGRVERRYEASRGRA